jgi:hypothetical protein
VIRTGTTTQDCAGTVTGLGPRNVNAVGLGPSQGGTEGVHVTEYVRGAVLRLQIAIDTSTKVWLLQMGLSHGA